MKAEEARNISKDAISGNMEELYQSIERAARLGDRHIHYYALLQKDQIEKLFKDGYQVKDISERNETIFRIDW